MPELGHDWLDGRRWCFDCGVTCDEEPCACCDIEEDAEVLAHA